MNGATVDAIAQNYCYAVLMSHLVCIILCCSAINVEALENPSRMLTKPDTITLRRSYCEQRLEELRVAIAGIDELAQASGLCIYVTGSYGRLEASEYSDLDLFFIHQGSQQSSSFSKITKTLIDAELIKTCRKLNFPEFSGDGRYLQVHHLAEILEELGSPVDDYENYFTARLLLLLESQPIYNETVYQEVMKKVIDAYFRDYHDHEADFRPIFLVNDITRFWKTLCLNYEHKRNRRPRKDEEKRNKNHLMNFKLKYSRLLTCFSATLYLSQNRKSVTPRTVLKLVSQPPLERLEKIAANTPERINLLSQIYEEYAWFLDQTGRPQEQVLAWIADRKTRDQAFKRARNFGSLIFDLLRSVVNDPETFRYLVI